VAGEFEDRLEAGGAFRREFALGIVQTGMSELSDSVALQINFHLY